MSEGKSQKGWRWGAREVRREVLRGFGRRGRSGGDFSVFQRVVWHWIWIWLLLNGYR